MKKNWLILFFMLTILNCSKKNISWVCYYGSDISPLKNQKFSFTITEPDNFQDVSYINSKYKIAYLSLGEVHKSRWYFNILKEKSLIFNENPNWKEAFKTDISNEIWHNLIINRIIPKILAKGYNGIFLDTVNEAVHDELYGNKKGLVKGITTLLKSIRSKYPDIFIIQNSGLKILKYTNKYINGVLIESLTATYDFKNKKYIPVKKEDISKKLKKIEDIRNKYNIDFFVIDYVDGTNFEIIKKSKKIANNNNLNLYLAEIGLDKIYDF